MIAGFDGTSRFLQPIVLLLDTSLSMKGLRLQLMKSAVEQIITCLSGTWFPDLFDTAIVTFNDEASVSLDFTPVSEVCLPEFVPNGGIYHDYPVSTMSVMLER